MSSRASRKCRQLVLLKCARAALIIVSVLPCQRKLDASTSPNIRPSPRAMGGKKIENRKLDVKTSYDWVALAALDPTGCRQLQARIETANQTQVWAILRLSLIHI